MIYEELQDAGQIIENILNQPLKLSDLPEDITLLNAALMFTDEDPATSTLGKVLLSLDDHPEAKDVLLRELDILAEELKS
jgi:hypothetical protein